MIKEIFLIRSISCICIVTLHSLLTTFPDYEQHGTIFKVFGVLLAAATPTFVFISEFILAKNYGNKGIPSDFLSKRAKYILLPFISFAIIYAYIDTPGFADFPKKALIYLLGFYHGYFLLVIFQFYILHIFFQRYIRRLSPKIVLFTSLIINVTYLYVFNFYSFPDNRIVQIFSSRGFWIPFPGWIFYFSVAYYCGLFYERFIRLLNQYIILVYILLLLSISLIVFLISTDILIAIGSKRIDVLPYTILVTFCMFHGFKRMKKISLFFITISRYSLGIYLLHPLSMAIINNQIAGTNPMMKFGILLTGAIILSMGMTYVLNLFPFGKFVVGRVGKRYHTS